MLRLLKRCAETAVKLPFAAAWDCLSLGNMGEGSSTNKVLREHRDKKYVDDLLEVTEVLRRMKNET